MLIEELIRVGCALREECPWLAREMQAPLHRLIHVMEGMEQAGTLDPLTGDQIEALALTWPHDSQKQPGMVAYTASPEKGEQDRQSVCKPSGFLARVLPGIPGNTVERILATLAGPQQTFRVFSGEEIAQTMAEIGNGHGDPSSCMTRVSHDWQRHPYLAFRSHGWELITRWEGDSIRARAITRNKEFVRIYGPCYSGQYSNPDDALLREWLESNGYSRASSWNGHRLELIEISGRWLAPYLDGGCSGVDEDGLIGHGHMYSFSDSGGWCSIEDPHDGEVETNAGEWIPEEEAIYLDYRDRSDGTRYEGYWHMDDCIRLDGEWYHSESIVRIDGTEYVAWDDDLVELECGELCHIDDAVCIVDYWYRCDDPAVCYSEHTGEYMLKEDCRELHDGEWAPKEDCVQLHDGEWALEEDTATAPDGSVWLADELPEKDFLDETVTGYPFPAVPLAEVAHA